MDTFNKRKRTNQNISDDDQSDNEEYSFKTPSENGSQHFPRFILIESLQENKSITSLSPFLIQKVIQSISGEPESIKKLQRTNQLLIEVKKKAHAENLLRTTTFHDLKVRVYPHTSLNTSKGVIRCAELRDCSEQEILDGTKQQGVTAVKRFKIRRDSKLKDTNTFVFTFNTPTLPKTVKVAYFRVNVEIYIPNPLRCHHCQKYGHHEDRCSRDPVCPNCGEMTSHSEKDCQKTPKCINCGQNHNANSKECQIWHKEKEILRVKFTRNISFAEARKIVEAPTPIPGISYANITQSSMKKVSVVDTATQTDPITILDSTVQSNTTNSKTEDLQKQKGQTNTTNKNQTKTAIEEKQGEGGLKKATMEMIRKDWKKQQQKERQARSQSSPPTKETKSKSSQGTQRPSTSNRERKGSNNVIQQHNRFGSLSDSSDDMELGEAPDRPRTNRNRSRSSEHSQVNNSNNRSKSPITYP